MRKLNVDAISCVVSTFFIFASGRGCIGTIPCAFSPSYRSNAGNIVQRNLYSRSRCMFAASQDYARFVAGAAK